MINKKQERGYGGLIIKTHLWLLVAVIIYIIILSFVDSNIGLYIMTIIIFFGIFFTILQLNEG